MSCKIYLYADFIQIGEIVMNMQDSKLSEKKEETVWDMLFKSKIRSYFIWYIVGYIIVTIYSCLRYNRPIIYNFFPIKLLPLILARNIGFVLYEK